MSVNRRKWCALSRRSAHNGALEVRVEALTNKGAHYGAGVVRSGSSASRGLTSTRGAKCGDISRERRVRARCRAPGCALLVAAAHMTEGRDGRYAHKNVGSAHQNVSSAQSARSKMCRNHGEKTRASMNKVLSWLSEMFMAERMKRVRLAGVIPLLGRGGAFWVLAVVGLAAGSRACLADDPNEAKHRPNVVLIMADDLGYGDVGYLGNTEVRTPEIDAMARSAIRLDRSYAAACVCSPTRGSVLTGRHPNRYGVFSWGWSLKPEEKTLAEILRPDGYATGHFGKWHLGSVAAYSATNPGAQGFEEWTSSPNFYENDPPLSRRGKVIHAEGEGSLATVDLALEFIDGAAKQQRPFLAVVWFGSPHSPHEALAADREPYKHLPEKLQHYYGEITAMDRAIGRLRARLRELKIADDTLVWFTSDNGATTPGSSGPFKAKKGTLWEGGVRVPGILEWPSKFPAPRTVDAACSTVDILPTVLAAVGVEHPQPKRPLDGENLLVYLSPQRADGVDDVVAGVASQRARPLGFWTYPMGGRPVKSGELLKDVERGAPAAGSPASPLLSAEETAAFAKKYPAEIFPGHAAWIDGRYKLHRIARGEEPPTFHLFDLLTDKGETTDLATSERGRVERMAEALEAWQKSVIGSLNGEDY